MGDGTAFPTSTEFLPPYIGDAEIFQQKMVHSLKQMEMRRG